MSEFTNVISRLPKAPLFWIQWDRKHFYFAKFRHANSRRIQIGWLVVNMRASWLEHSARALYPHLFRAKPEAITWARRAKWAENFLKTYASGDGQKLLGGYDFHGVVRHLAGAVQQLTSAAPECAYCGTTEGLRVKCDGGMFAFGRRVESPEYTCEGCFAGSDTGPCFDDLPIADDTLNEIAESNGAATDDHFNAPREGDDE